jgi:hypothetical protein
MATLIQNRRGTAAQWTSANPTLAAGEIGVETDTGQMKIGNGSTAWTSLAYSAMTSSSTTTLTNKTIALGSNTVSGTTAQFNTALTDGDFATLAGTETLANKTLTTPVITQGTSTPTFTTNAYTIVSTDAGLFLLASNSSTAGTINIPTDATWAAPNGTQIHIQQTGSGQLTIQAASSGTTTVTSNGATVAAPKIRAQYSVATLIKLNTNAWTVIGDIA